LLSHSPTEEQEAIYTAAATTDANIMISALAGTGKTSTLEALQSRVKAKPILYLVFNRKNADEAEKKMLSTTTVRSFNGQGHRIWASTGRELTLVSPKDGNLKTKNILREIINSSPKAARDQIWSVWNQVVSGVGLAKSLGYIPQGVVKSDQSLITQTNFHKFLDEAPDDLVSDLIDAVLRTSIKLAFDGTIDYNDQVYMPALFGGVFPKFPLVLADEYQDLSPVDHALLHRIVADRRLAGVGDPWQNIYGFRGAMAGGMDGAISKYKMEEFPLSISFRCPSAIVSHVHWRVPHFKAHHEGGKVSTPPKLAAHEIPDNATIICRNNAPLFAIAFRLIGIGHSVSVAGSDIGPRIVSIMRKLGNDEMTQGQVLSAINDWEAEKLANESKSAADLAACMRIFARQGQTLSIAIAYAEHLFKQSGTIKLMTGHKSKGLEFNHVIHLDPWLCGDSEQDQNLRYVISTRSLDQLVEINSDRIEW